MKLRAPSILLLVSLLISSTGEASAAIKAGSKCTKLNQVRSLADKTLKCQKVKGKLVWVVDKVTVKEAIAQEWQVQPNSIIQESNLNFQLYSPEKTVKIGNTYRSYFVSKQDGALVYNESADGVSYTKLVKTNLKRSPDPGTDTTLMDHPVVIKMKNEKFLLVYDICTGNCSIPPSLPRRLVSRISDDGVNWGPSSLIPGPSRTGLNPEGKIFDSVPTLLQLSSGDLRLYYVQGGAAIGSAISKDNGVTWTVEDGFRLGTPYGNTPKSESFIDPAVIQDSDGTIYLYFGYITDWNCMESGGTPNGCVPLRVARSKNGLDFTMDPKPVINPGPGATQIGDPDLFIGTDGKWRILYAYVENTNKNFSSLLRWAVRTK